MWTFEHSVECKAERGLRLAVLDQRQQLAGNGLFGGISRPRWSVQSGAKFITKPRGGEAINGELEDVRDGRGAVVVIRVPGAALRCVWKFEDAGTRATRLTQQATIQGEQAQNYLSEVAELERTIPQGMQRLAETIEQFALGSALGRWLCLF